MSRAAILADTLARLEVERCTPLPPRPAPEPLGWTPEEQAEHRRALLEAIGPDLFAIDYRERQATG